MKKLEELTRPSQQPKKGDRRIKKSNKTGNRINPKKQKRKYFNSTYKEGE